LHPGDVRGSYNDFAIPAGEWFRTAFYAKWNTPGQSDGIYKLWRNDVLIVELYDVKYRTTEKTPDSLWIGGNYSGGGTDPVPFDRYIDDIFVARTPADDPEFNPTVPESFDANGTAGPDAFVLAYSGNTADSTVSVSVSSNGATAQDLGTFPMSTAINLNGFGGTDSVRVVGSNLNDSFDVSGAGLLVNGSRVVLNRIERRTLVGGIGNDSYKFDSDASLGNYSLSETGSGIDTIDFSKTSNLGVVMSLGTTVDQIVNQNVRLRLNSASAFENLIGGAGYDILTGNAHPNRITGNEGGDRIDGGSASDVLVGGSGNDHYIFKADGVADEVDSIIEASGRESDTLDFSALSIPVKVNISTGAQQTIHTNRSLILGSGVGVENVVGGFGNDRLIGNSRSNTLVGNAGNDIINGWLGSDQLIGGPGSDTYWFGRATVGGEVDTISETARQDSDKLDFSSRLTAVRVNISTGLQQIVHTDRSLILGSGLAIENITGGSGDDSLTGNSLANTVIGNAGNDILNGGLGSDLLIGGRGDDRYVFGGATVGGEPDTITEASNLDRDTLDFSSRTIDVTMNISDSVNQQQVHTDRKLKLSSGLGIDIVLGGSGNDRLTGSSIANVLVGNGGNDTLIGNSGRDILIGGQGLDTISGGNDDDIVIAGRTTSDANPANLSTLLTGWLASTSYSTRVAALRAGVGSPKVSLVKKSNVVNDSGQDDQLSGGAGTDWFFRATDDVIADLFSGELLDVTLIGQRHVPAFV